MIKTKENSEHYFWGDQCESWVLNGSENLSVKSEKMPPKTKEVLHFHMKAQQFFYILKGVASFHIEDKVFQVEENQGIEITAGKKHFIANNSLEDLEFLVISQPDTKEDRFSV